MSGAPVLTVTLSGAAGQIGYSLLPLLANGRVFGGAKIHLRLLDINMGTVADILRGVKMELEDGAYPNLLSVTTCVADLEAAFTGCDVAVLTGGFPRRAGMERKDLIEKNAAIFGEQGAAIEAYASTNVKVLVVANPANTNCLILKSAAPKVPAENFTALTFLDHNRAKAQLAIKLQCSIADIKKVCIWGNHSSTQVPDASNGTVNGNPIVSTINDGMWMSEWVQTVQTRGAAVINARKLSSAMSAANAIGDHLNTWLVKGTDADDFVSLAVISDGSYGITKGLVYSFPVTCAGDGTYSIVQDLVVNEETRAALKKTEQELIEEKSDADEILARASA